MDEEFISLRLAKLRTAKKVSAREMSLDIGQNENYINQVENKKAMPSMQVFFYICDYLAITPKEFFDDGINNPVLIQSIVEDLKQLNENYIMNLHEIIKGLKK